MARLSAETTVNLDPNKQTLDAEPSEYQKLKQSNLFGKDSSDGEITWILHW